MTAVRSILIFLYFLTMVLLPYGHMPFHAEGHAEVAEGHHGCQHHHHEPDPESDSDSDSESDSGHDCSLCNLTVLLTDVPSVFSFTDFCFTLHTQAERDNTFSDPSLLVEHKARAPPFMTV
ncbi:hypothetical protein P4B35_02470 [Pontiellaceae bacterium B12227]|nr:hypothetical protein [Pontiellaceae bacterium B12227]